MGLCYSQRPETPEKSPTPQSKEDAKKREPVKISVPKIDTSYYPSSDEWSDSPSPVNVRTFGPTAYGGPDSDSDDDWPLGGLRVCNGIRMNRAHLDEVDRLKAAGYRVYNGIDLYSYPYA